MGVHDFISEAEAVTATGVSTKTLGRFIESGYLQPEFDSDGTRLFSREELEALFGFGLYKVDIAERDSRELINTEEGENSSGILEEESSECVIEPGRNSESESPKIVRPHAAIEVSDLDPNSRHEAAASSNNSRPASHSNEDSKANNSLNNANSRVTIPSEHTKLFRLIELQEQLLEARESEIEDLKEQREWLRCRIEKLEEKNDRDQLILLSETQVIRKLVMTREQQQRSPIRAALEWLGFVERRRSMASAQMIELQHKDAA